MKNVIKKNQLAILVIALMLVTAGYLNYTADNSQDLITTSSNVSENTNISDTTLVNNQVTDNEIVQNNTVSSENATNNIGQNEIQIGEEQNEETIETTAQSSKKDDYFVTSKLQRDTMYSQMIESYQKILESSTISTEQKAIASQEISNINNTKNAIMICENLIQTKGFPELVIFVNDKSISIIIKAEEITTEQIAQIQNIVAREMKAEIENIHISNKS